MQAPVTPSEFNLTLLRAAPQMSHIMPPKRFAASPKLLRPLPFLTARSFLFLFSKDTVPLDSNSFPILPVAGRCLPPDPASVQLCFPARLPAGTSPNLAPSPRPPLLALPRFPDLLRCTSSPSCSPPCGCRSPPLRTSPQPRPQCKPVPARPAVAIFPRGPAALRPARSPFWRRGPCACPTGSP